MEEQVLQVPIKGIMRNASIAQIENGGCDEVINLRFKEGSWRPVYDKTLLATLSTQYDSVYKHNVSGAAAEIWIGFVSSSGKVYAHIMTSPSIAQIELLDIGTETFSRISHINNYLIVWTTTNRHILVWDSDNYNPPSTSGYTVLPDLPNIEMFVTSYTFRDTILGQKASYPEAYADYLKSKEERRDGGLYEGNMMVMCAFKLSDGSYIKHSQPFYLQLGRFGYNSNIDDDGYEAISRLYVNYQSVPSTVYRFVSLIWNGAAIALRGLYYGYPKITFLWDSSQILDIQKYSGIIISVDIFATYPTSIYRPDESDTGGYTGGLINQVSMLQNEQFNETQITYYKIKSIPVEDITTSEIAIPLPNSNDFQAAETLSVDSYSNHKLISKNHTNYNSRQHLGDITTILGLSHNPFVNGADTDYIRNYCDVYADWSSVGSVDLKLFAYLKTDVGEKIIEHDIEVTTYDTASPSIESVILKPFISYPDSRCYKIEMFVKNVSTDDYTSWITIRLSKHPVHNYAYKYASFVYESFDFNGETAGRTLFESIVYPKPTYGADYTWNGIDPITPPASGDTLPTEDNILNEPNRLQLSGINNPFYLPSINSYRVGNMDDTIYGVQPSVAPVSENQFGQHPVFVFTRGAIYAMMVGENDVVYSAIIPVVNETFDSSSQFLPVRNGVVYTCDRGLKYIEGRSVLDIDNFIREKPDGYLNADTAFMQLFTQAGNENLSTALSEQPFLIYLANAIMAYDNVEDELIISNPTESLGALSYDYSYVFNFKSQSWSKLSNGFSKFVNLFPGYAGLIKVTTTWKLYDISTEDINTRTQQCMIVTRPIKLSGSGYKRITKGFLRCNLSRYSGTFYFQFYVYGSVDGVVWKYISGKSIPKSADIIDIGINKHHVSCKYYIFVFHGNIDIDNTISFIDLQFANIANNKLR